MSVNDAVLDCSKRKNETPNACQRTQYAEGEKQRLAKNEPPYALVIVAPTAQ